ncbi:MAG: DUF4404 family protein [Deltaproteobacteria bacterium]|nr:DUF4404 family protein [Deltaproteobacteria bacterium]MBN2672643.1 DUF4404 family protein [Deltaproteobacteria bacterium]
MPKEVREQIKQLQSELKNLPDDTEALEARLSEASENIETYDSEGIDTFIDDVETEIRKLEVEYPQLTSMLNQVMTALSNWGI